MQPFLVNTETINRYGKTPEKYQRELSAVHRINCLAGLKAAGHGWLGASFSCIEILTTIYHRFIKNPSAPMTERSSIHLSKGHAAMAQYAILAAMGCFSVEKLLKYKQIDGLPAHCDRDIPGVDSDSGSLGQGLSKALGIAVSNRRHGKEYPVFAIIGDGELQEGQLFEAFLSLKKLNPGNCIPIIDRNWLQSDSRTSDIKDADDWATVFRGIGLKVFEIDGHDHQQIFEAINSVINSETAGVIIARTRKGMGTSLTSMSPETERRRGIWHGQIPNDSEYVQMLEELSAHIDDQQLATDIKNYLKSLQATPEKTQQPVISTNEISTGQAFAEALVRLASDDKQIFVLDADLEKSCRLTKAAEAFGERFLEIGISEQDMCSIAAGLGLNGNIAVVNTYASFYKRSLDQISACVTEKVPVIFAGHYAGSDYFTDGKSHQSINDLGLIRSLGDIQIYEPIDAANTEQMLKLCIERMKSDLKDTNRCRPAYFRLHRTPAQSFKPCCFSAEHMVFQSEIDEVTQQNRIFTCGPHMLKICLEASKKLASEGISLEVVAVTQFSDSNREIKKLIDSSFRFFTFEDHIRETGLGSFIAGLTIRNPVKIGIKKPAPSSMNFAAMLEYHSLSSNEIIAVVKKVLACVHEK